MSLNVILAQAFLCQKEVILLQILPQICLEIKLYFSSVKKQKLIKTVNI